MEFQNELVVPNDGLSFKLFLFEGGGGNYDREKHWHTVVEIFAVLEGSLSFYINDVEYPLHAGQLMVVNSNEIHSIHAMEENYTVVLQIPLKQFEEYFTAQRFIKFRSVIEEGNQKLLGLMRKLYQVYEAKAVGCEFRVYSIYYQILYLLVNKYRLTEVPEKEIRCSRHLDTLSTIIAYMREHYQEDLKLSEVASVFGYSDAYLSRMFRKYAKVNFKTYLQDIRVAYAYRDLMNTDHTISRIALDNGFGNSRAFAKEFQKRYDQLPSRMRMEKRQG